MLKSLKTKDNIEVYYNVSDITTGCKLSITLYTKPDCSEFINEIIVREGESISEVLDDIETKCLKDLTFYKIGFTTLGNFLDRKWITKVHPYNNSIESDYPPIQRTSLTEKGKALFAPVLDLRCEYEISEDVSNICIYIGRDDAEEEITLHYWLQVLFDSMAGYCPEEYQKAWFEKY